MLLLSDAHYSQVLVIDLAGEKKSGSVRREGIPQGPGALKKDILIPEFSPLKVVSTPQHPTLVPFHPPLSKVTFNPIDHDLLCTTGDDLFQVWS